MSISDKSHEFQKGYAKGLQKRAKELEGLWEQIETYEIATPSIVADSARYREALEKLRDEFAGMAKLAKRSEVTAKASAFEKLVVEIDNALHPSRSHNKRSLRGGAK